MYKLKLKHHFDAAHRLDNYKGKCSNIHGHRWEVEVMIEAHDLKDDMVIDFSEIKKLINKLDHKMLIHNTEENGAIVDCLTNERMEIVLFSFKPTAENLAKYLHNEIEKLFEEGSLYDMEVTIFESPNASISFTN